MVRAVPVTRPVTAPCHAHGYKATADNGSTYNIVNKGEEEPHEEYGQERTCYEERRDSCQVEGMILVREAVGEEKGEHAGGNAYKADGENTGGLGGGLHQPVGIVG